MKSKTKVRSISVDRLFNLGNYEHVKFSVTVDVDARDKTSAVLVELVELMRGLRPPKIEAHQLGYARKVLATPESELNEWDKAHLEDARARVKLADDQLFEWNNNVAKFDALGGVSKRTDHKLTWNDDNDVPF